MENSEKPEEKQHPEPCQSEMSKHYQQAGRVIFLSAFQVYMKVKLGIACNLKSCFLHFTYNKHLCSSKTCFLMTA